MNTQVVKISDIKPNPENPRIIKDDKFVKLVQSIKDFPKMLDIRPIVVNDEMVVLGGNMRLKACKEAGFKEVTIIKASNLTKEEQEEFIIKDNVGFGEWDFEMLANQWDFEILESWGLDIPSKVDPSEESEQAYISLASQFIFPPFSVLDSKGGEWQKRKKLWRSLGIESETGREGVDLFTSMNKLLKGGFQADASIFDPVLTEILVSWYSVPGHKVLDPFAGGSVRGIVSQFIKREYHGVDLRKEQIEANEKNFKEIAKKNSAFKQNVSIPNWHVGDSTNIRNIVKDQKYDLIFSCPPYIGLEKYSDDPNDISGMDVRQFDDAYSEIIRSSVEMLNDDRFAVFVISEVRDKKGYYENFIGMTIRAFQAAGMKYYNEIVFLNSMGSAPARARKPFSYRKTTRVHQNALVFYKGNPERLESFKKCLVFFKGDTDKIPEEFPFENIHDYLTGEYILEGEEFGPEIE